MSGEVPVRVTDRCGTDGLVVSSGKSLMANACPAMQRLSLPTRKNPCAQRSQFLPV